jgi:hypothetical protein
LPSPTTLTMRSRAPAYIVASIKSDYFGFIATKYIITRHPEVAKSTTYLLIKNLKEYRAAYPVLFTVP